MKQIIFSLLLVFTSQLSFSQTKSFIDFPYIEVTGSADTMVTPDRIYVRILLSEKETKDKISVEELEGRMIAALKELSINIEKDLVLSDMLSNYKFYLLKQKDIIKTKEYSLQLVDAGTVTKVFVALENIGISNVSITDAEVSNHDLIENICREKAIEDAKNKAIAFVKPLNQSIGSAIYIADNAAAISNQLRGSVSGVQIRGYSSLNKEAYEPPKIELKKKYISASVQAKFALK